LLLAITAVSALTGCAGGAAVVSPTDQALIAQADQLHARLQPALLETRDPKLKRYFEQLGARVTAAAKDADQEGLIKPPAPSAGSAASAADAAGGSNAWMFGKDVDFHLVDSEIPNAFTSGGKHVYVYNGLFQQCRSEDELAALLCREYAHVYARHVQQELRRDPNQSGDNALLFPFATLRVSPAQARSAEAIAFTIFTRAGWDPTRFASLYQRMLEGGAAPADADRALLREKVIEAQRRTDALPPAAQNWAQPPVADDARFAQLQTGATTALARAPRTPEGRDDRVSLLLATFPSALAPGDTPTQTRARQKLFPPPPVPTPTENQWGKGIGGK
jgi:predicted Zn-dependent protease